MHISFHCDIQNLAVRLPAITLALTDLNIFFGGRIHGCSRKKNKKRLNLNLCWQIMTKLIFFAPHVSAMNDTPSWRTGATDQMCSESLGAAEAELRTAI